MPRALTLAFAMTLAACAARQPALQQSTDRCLVDLTHAYDENTLYWPTSPTKFEKKTLFYGHTEDGYFYSAYTISTPEHGGTHLDAPIHFAEGQDTTEAIALERLVAPGVVIDMTDAAARDRDALLTVEHIESFEREHGAIEPGTIVLVRTGWSRYWPDAKQYLGDDRRGEEADLHFPGISEAAAEVLVARQVAAVGIDTASIDNGPSKGAVAHRVLMEKGIPGFENVSDLDKVPPRGAEILALPMKIAGGSGGPLRIVARVPGGLCPGAPAP